MFLDGFGRIRFFTVVNAHLEELQYGTPRPDIGAARVVPFVTFGLLTVRLEIQSRMLSALTTRRTYNNRWLIDSSKVWWTSASSCCCYFCSATFCAGNLGRCDVQVMHNMVLEELRRTHAQVKVAKVPLYIWKYLS